MLLSAAAQSLSPLTLQRFSKILKKHMAYLILFNDELTSVIIVLFLVS